MKTKKRSLVKADGEAFTEALNAATVEDLERALRFKGLPADKRKRIQAALDNKRRPKPEAGHAAPATVEKPKTAPKRKTKAERPAKARRPGALDAAVTVLAEAGKPMNCQQMMGRMLETGLWKTKGRTPSQTLYSAILRELQHKGAEARFRKVDRGQFELSDAAKKTTT